MSKALILLCVIAVSVRPAVSFDWPACSRLVRHVWHQRLVYHRLDSAAGGNIAEPVKYARDPNGQGNTFSPVQNNEKPLPIISISGVVYELQTLKIHNLDMYRTPTASAVVQVTLATRPPNDLKRLIIVVPLLEDDEYPRNKIPMLQLDLQHLLALGGQQSYETNLEWLLRVVFEVTVLKKPPIDSHGYDEDSTLVFLTKCVNTKMLPLASLFPSYCDSD